MANASLRPLRESEFGYWQASHLLTRAGFGGTPDQIRLLADWGLEKSVRHLVYFENAPSSPVTSDSFDDSIMAPPSPEERLAYRRALQAQDEATVERFRERRQEQQRQDRRQIREVQRWWLKRLIESPRPLEEKMTLFFHGHFATSYRKVENSYHLFLQNQTFRKHATGNFADLCFQIIRDPAMIAYLDNNNSHRRSPNENLARELMELFTLGEGVAYSERDIKEGARALTGYTYDYNSFIFREEWHDNEPKRILGKLGNFNGDDFVRIILGRPECSVFLCLKLYRFFVNDLPNGADRETRTLIESLAREMRSNKYDLAPTLETLFKSEAFYDEANVAARIKSPAQLAVQATRAMRLPIRDLNLVVEALDLMGQNLFFPPSVKGWEGGRSWINTSTLYVRQNLLTHLLTGQMPSGFSASGGRLDLDAMSLLTHLERDDRGEYDIDQAVRYLVKLSFGRDIEESRMTELMQFTKSHGGRMSNDLVVALLCLMTAMPEYQLC
ncbi:MAG: DUF1800 family protein [Phycisphaerales bacterium]